MAHVPRLRRYAQVTGLEQAGVDLSALIPGSTAEDLRDTTRELWWVQMDYTTITDATGNEAQWLEIYSPGGFWIEALHMSSATGAINRWWYESREPRNRLDLGAESLPGVAHSMASNTGKIPSVAGAPFQMRNFQALATIGKPHATLFDIDLEAAATRRQTNIIPWFFHANVYHYFVQAPVVSAKLGEGAIIVNIPLDVVPAISERV